MALPANVTLSQVSPTMVEVRGWASEPFVMTEASARRNLERVRSRRSTYASVVEYERHLSVPVEAMRLMGWEVPEDKDAPVQPAPTPPPAAPAARPGPREAPNPPLPGPQAAPVAQPQMEFDFEGVPPVPGPARRDGPVAGPAKTWVEQMLEDKTSQV